MSTWHSTFRRRHTQAVVAMLTLLLASSPWVPPLSLATQLIFLAFAVAIFGLPHGALDLTLVGGAFGLSRLALAAAIGIYLGISAAVIALWLLAPVAALLGFLGIAIIHFGLGDTDELRPCQRSIETMARGGFVGIAPLVFHPVTTRDLFAMLVGPSSSNALDVALTFLIPTVTWLWLSSLGVALIWRLIQHKIGWLAAVAEMLLTLCLFAVFHPLAAFLVYFSFIHSVRHIADLGAARFPNSGLLARRWLVVESLPLTTITVLLGGVACLVFGWSMRFDEAMMRVIFWGLSALTMPHMILTAWWHSRGDPKPSDLFTSRN